MIKEWLEKRKERDGSEREEFVNKWRLKYQSEIDQAMLLMQSKQCPLKQESKCNEKCEYFAAGSVHVNQDDASLACIPPRCKLFGTEWYE